jgi:N-acetylglucosamine kinase-like BadF-type ATPase
MFYLGIDGGGTKTDYEIIDDKGNILSNFSTQTCNYIQIGFENYGKTIMEGATRVCNKAGIGISDLNFTFVGIPSLGESIEDSTELVKVTGEVLGSRNFKCGNDVEVAWAGALACEPGINIVAGTGSIGFGRDQGGNSARAGGWGYFCGDEGSAYWLGRKLIGLFARESDGRMEKSRLYEIVRDKFGLKRDMDFISVIYDDFKLKRDEVSKLQLLLCDAAEQGDTNAIEAYREAAYELSLLVGAIIDKLNFNSNAETAVSYSGGVFKAGGPILTPFEKYITKNNAKLKKPQLKPVTGAALYSLKSSGRVSDSGIIDNLRRQENSAPGGK